MNTLVKEYFKNKNRSDETIKNYNNAINSFEEKTGVNLSEFIQEALIEQSPKIIDSRLIEMPIASLKINKHYNTFIEESKAIGNTNNSIMAQLKMVGIILHHYGVKTPDVDLENDKKEWHPLKKEHIRFLIEHSDLQNKALLTFLASTGVRVKDATELTIKDYMEATEPFHHTTDLESFLETTNPDMFGFFTFLPNKTKRSGVVCKTINSRESNHFIMQNLRRRMEITDGELSKDDALFSSRVKKHKGKLSTKTITINLLNKKENLYRYIRMKANEDLKNEIISETEHEKIITNLPTVNAHALRKYFITTLSNERLPLRVSAVLEGHAPPMKLDGSYSKISDDVIIEEYKSIEPKLTFLKEEREFEMDELEAENLKLKEENERIKAEIEEITTNQVNVKLDEKQEELLSKIEKAIEESGLKDRLNNLHLEK